MIWPLAARHLSCPSERPVVYDVRGFQMFSGPHPTSLTMFDHVMDVHHTVLPPSLFFTGILRAIVYCMSIDPTIGTLPWSHDVAWHLRR